ncbi:Alpha beta hydrolase fold protein [Neofusicoccum parvum]|uniref:Alpha beta hydrolase fold protein n=1 Tax=Neofusicoccum parvum TaxID=310453 RepID=A0ACB5SG18_9PEZI|nr:Alpha beta hydrolase fold protein [Neofusicoccum parvum]
MAADDPTEPLLSTRLRNNNVEPVPSTPIPFPKRVIDFITVWTIKTIVRTYTTFLKLLSLLHLRPRPTLTKVYPCVPSVTARIFLPPSPDAPAPSALPLLISIHGGGFAIGDAVLDDGDALAYARTHGIAVASIGYRRGPRARFPAAVDDVAALVEALLDDAALAAFVDRARVAVCGYSAGGNLCLAATQLRGLRARVRAAVAFYPVVDFSLRHEDRVARARVAGVPVDAPNQSFGWVRWAYVKEGQDLRDPLISPMFASRDRLPRKVCLIGCEHDVLCDEAERMAEKLAAEDGEGERRIEEGGNAWRTANVRWEKVLGQPHAFNQIVIFGKKKRELAKRRTEQMHAEVAKWLFEEVFV